MRRERVSPDLVLPSLHRVIETQAMNRSRYSRLIREIIEFKAGVDKIDSTNLPRKLIGELGELYVCERLCGMGFKNIVPKGGHAPYDILLKDEDVRIEVRTSLLKNEGLYPDGIDFFGWRVKTKNQKEDQRFDVLVGIALPESFKEPEFYVFSYGETEKLADMPHSWRYPNIRTKIHLFRDTRAFKRAVRAKPQLVTRFERYINKHPEGFKDRWDKLKKA